MPTRIRNLLLILSCLLFLVLGAYLVLLQKGWAWNSKEWKIVKSGGIYLSSTPRGSAIAIDGVPYPDTTGFLSSGILIQHLVPKPYAITLAKPGFYPWKKTLTVESGKVVSAHDIFLWPQKPTPHTIGTSTEDFWMTREGSVELKSGGVLRFGNATLRGTAVEAVSPDASAIVIQNKTARFFTDLGNPGVAINLSTLFLSLMEQRYPAVRDTKIEHVFLHPFSQTKILLSTKTALYALDIRRIDIERITLFPSGSLVAIGSDNGAILTPQGDVLAFNLILNTFSSTTLPTPPAAPTKISLSPNGAYLFIETQNSGFYIYNRETQKIERIMKEGVVTYAASRDSRRLALITGNKKLILYYLKDFEGDRLVPRGTLETAPFAFPVASTSRIVWLAHQDSALLLNLHSVVGVDVSMRSPTNSVTLYTGLLKSEFGNQLFMLQKTGELVSVDLEG